MLSSRVDYDAIADLYDSQPYRGKSGDLELAGFIAERGSRCALTLVDIACGTGSQLIANRSIAPAARMVGIDGSIGMLRQARRKSPDLAWLQADAARLPLASVNADFISCQYAFHHFQNKDGMLREAFRVLRPGGRLIIYNLCPHDMADWIYYAYFPEAQARDLVDFWLPERTTLAMRTAGFAKVAAQREHIRFDHDLGAFLDAVRRRDNNSQLMALSDASYADGLRRIEHDAAPEVPRQYSDHLCFLTVRGDKPANIT